MPKYLKNEDGAASLVVLLAFIALLVFLLITNTFNFKDTLFSVLFPKPHSHAATPVFESVNNGYGTFKAGNWPGSNWRPYSDNSPFNQILPASPKLDPNSAAIVSRMFAGKPNQIAVGTSTVNAKDYDHPLYFSQPTDPVYTIACTQYGTNCAIKGAQVRIPVGAKPANGSDRHMTIIDQSTGVEWDFWQADIPSGIGGPLSISWGGKTDIKGSGITGDATAALFGLAAGNVRAKEWENGEIDHALFITLSCDNGQIVFPATGHGLKCSDVTNSAPMGARFYLDMTDDEINALSEPSWLKTIHKTMAHYGMYFGDTAGANATWQFKTESGATYTSFGYSDPYIAFAQKVGAQPWAGYYLFHIEGIDYANKLKMVDPCVTQVGTADCLPPASPMPLPSSPGTVSSGVNLVKNPGCEIDTSNWGGYQASLSRNTNFAHSGVASCQVSLSTGNVDTMDDSPDSVSYPKQGDTYTATAWVRSDNAVGKPVYLYIRQRGGTKATSNARSSVVYLSTSWLPLKAQAVVDAPDRTSLDVYIEQDSGVSRNSFQVDDISLVNGSGVTP